MALAFLLGLALPAAAETRPAPRPVDADTASGVPLPEATAAVPESVRPVARPAPAGEAVSGADATAPGLDGGGAVRVSERPTFRPADLFEAMGESLRGPRGGGLCGRATIRGERVGPLDGDGGCGIPIAVQVTQVGGVSLSQPARIDCDTARALDDWVRDALLPTVGQTGGGAAGLRTGPGYACRGRNNQPDAKLSEHSLGKAIDIFAIELAGGDEIALLADWDDGAKGGANRRILRALHRAACGPFGTVLGPEANAFHADHFHFDTAKRRQPYCR